MQSLCSWKNKIGVRPNLDVVGLFSSCRTVTLTVPPLVMPGWLFLSGRLQLKSSVQVYCRKFGYRAVCAAVAAVILAGSTWLFGHKTS